MNTPQPLLLARPSSTATFALAIALLLLGQLQLGLAQGVIAADLALIALITWWVIVSQADEGRRVARAILLPLALILMGSAMAMTVIGIKPWAARDLILDIGSILTFLATLAVAAVAGPAQWRWLRTALNVGLLIVLGQLLMSGSETLRASAGFPNPNLAGHYVVTVTATAVMLAHRREQRIAIGLFGGFAWLLTGSFGALLQGAVMVAYRLISRSKRGVVATASLFGAAGLLAILSMQVLGTIGVSSGLTISGLSTDRLNRSAEGRLTKWLDGLEALTDQPWGVGPGSVEALGLADNELHNEPLAYLVERGPLGLAGLVTLILSLWLLSRPAGTARMLLLGFSVASLFRETSHYRHLWICLALAMAWESTRRPVNPDPIDRRQRSGLTV